MNLNQEKFAKIYAICGNATRSYLEAYPNSSYDTARAEGCELLAKPEIKEKINELKELQKAETDLVIDSLKKRFKKVILQELEDYELMKQQINNRIQIADLSIKQLLDLSKIRNTEMMTFSKVAEMLVSIEGLKEMEDALIKLRGNDD